VSAWYKEVPLRKKITRIAPDAAREPGFHKGGPRKLWRLCGFQMLPAGLVIRVRGSVFILQYQMLVVMKARNGTKQRTRFLEAVSSCAIFVRMTRCAEGRVTRSGIVTSSVWIFVGRYWHNHTKRP